MKPPKRSSYRTQWAAQFAVASELCKRNYQIAFTLGNHPSFDLLVVSPSGKQFTVDVKGLYRRNYWQVRQRTISSRHFYIFAYVPDDTENCFFIMKQNVVSEGIRSHKKEFLAKKRKIHSPYREGLLWEQVEKYKDKWKHLPR